MSSHCSWGCGIQGLRGCGIQGLRGCGILGLRGCGIQGGVCLAELKWFKLVISTCEGGRWTDHITTE